ncbi:hypothetical protein BKP45_04875 [Anaerobacillus alkalidiazotrophicus]|uniref:Terminase small subunit n=1 Tax=Anaerobacillus alkalidiazotrophicus TaxID=472963 RepID=A0A1S2MC41_9BACI|nr:terminase small subunit [Anaerobacillus alkalidiazotrophicus]OIJ22013.1 hypothetical protein BKP45_04875 [Anaerobacillus alkalidiazotrophicus]
MENLTPKQQRFIEEYLVDLNGSAAAVRAGYSIKTSRVIAAELLTKPNIQAAIKEQMDAAAMRNQVTVDDIVQQLAKIAFADIKDFVSWDEQGNVQVKAAAEVDGTVISEISSIDTQNGKNFKFRRNDQLKALELLSRHLGMLIDRKEITGANGGSIEIKFVEPSD